jgi:beta-galactosidase/beta-glucuronidase
MDNRIKEITVRTTRLDPVQAELEIVVELEKLTSDTKLQGRLVGPHCPHTTTIEVAYPLREKRQAPSPDREPCMALQVVIPEPSIWEPQTPYVYDGHVELREGTQMCDRREFSTGLRMRTAGS